MGFFDSDGKRGYDDGIKHKEKIDKGEAGIGDILDQFGNILAPPKYTKGWDKAVNKPSSSRPSGKSQKKPHAITGGPSLPSSYSSVDSINPLNGGNFGLVIFAFYIILAISYYVGYIFYQVDLIPKVANLIWSPTSDPFLNFFIDIIIILLAIPFFIATVAIGVIVLVLYGIFIAIFWLADISPTFKIISILISIGIPSFIIYKFILARKS